jgi:CRISPR-associated protein Cas6
LIILGKKMADYEPKVDICFQIIGKLIPVDHGFALYGAISRLLPLIHEDKDIALKLIRGRYIGEGLLDISPCSELILRLPKGKVAQYLGLVGTKFDLSGQVVRIGEAHTKALIPATALYAPLVTTRNGQSQERFEIEIKNQTANLSLNGRLAIGKRRTFQVHGKQVVGYAVMLSELNAQESILLQEHGLGGRRKMGCGFFEVWKG